MIHLVTFASEDMSKSAELCDASARAQGVESSWPWNQAMLRATECYQQNKALFDQARGCGFFAWKPLILTEAMKDSLCKDGDILIYADAGLEFIEPVRTIIDLMDQDIWLFGNEHLHAHWCKRDIIDAICPASLYSFWVGDNPGWGRFGKQAQASVIFFRVNDYTRKFVKEWLYWCLYGVQTFTDVDGYKFPKAVHYLIDDSPSIAPNHPEFIENRHDQAILTTMAYREGIKLHEWYVKYEGYTPGRMTGYPRELERPFVFHHRRRNSEWEGIAA